VLEEDTSDAGGDGNTEGGMEEGGKEDGARMPWGTVHSAGGDGDGGRACVADDGAAELAELEWCVCRKSARLGWQ
jgi:hypothetical protein